MSFGIGDTVGTYKIVAAIGSGGMGEVFRVEHVVTNRVEAMKILAAQTSRSPEQDQRFLREIQLQASLSHPNIAAVHNAFWENGRLVMIMELIQGASLLSLLERTKVPLTASFDYACQALAALDYAHAHGVVHRDISPSNMIVTEDGTLKLTDFGLAKSLGDIRLTQTGALVGSLYYTSPEQVQGQANVDSRADIYSLGAVLYEMATGSKPFSFDNPFTLMLAHVEQTPRRPSHVNPGLPAAIDEILLKALDKNPEKRFQSAELFRCALEAVNDGCREHPGAIPKLESSYDNSRSTAAPPPQLRRPETTFSPTIAPLAIRRSPLVKAAAVLVCALLLPYAWTNAFFAASHTQADLPDLAAMPVTWPSDLMPILELTYSGAHKPSVPRAAYGRRNVITITDENGVRSEIRSGPKRQNPFLSAMHHVAQPLHRNADTDHSPTTAKVSSEPATN